jgi:hypothetical protein
MDYLLNYWWILIVAVVIISAFVFKILKRGADKVSDFFWGAWKAYVFKNDYEGYVAALTAAVVAKGVQSESFIVALKTFKIELASRKFDETNLNEELTHCLSRLDALIIELTAIQSAPSDPQEVVKAKLFLSKSYPDAAEALAKFDGDYFYQRHPELRSD